MRGFTQTFTSDGFDGVPSIFVFPHMCNHLLQIVNTVLTTSKFPKEWKIARIRPISSLLRPVSIPPCLSKVAEHIMNEQLDLFLNNGSVLHDDQFRFLYGSCYSKLFIFGMQSIRGSLNVDMTYVLVVLELTKAYDGVPYIKQIV